MMLTYTILFFDMIMAFAFVWLMSRTGAEYDVSGSSGMITLRRSVYCVVALVLMWRAGDIVEGGRQISTVGAAFNVVMTLALFILSVARRFFRLP